MEAQAAERAAGPSDRQLKILMVHGIGHHIPGYSGRLTEQLMPALGLDVRDENSKDFTLVNPKVGWNSLGHLRASRFSDKAGTRELVFYELTWSLISLPGTRKKPFRGSFFRAWVKMAGWVSVRKMATLLSNPP